MLRRCPKCRTDEGLVYCPVCHGTGIRPGKMEIHGLPCSFCGGIAKERAEGTSGPSMQHLANALIRRENEFWTQPAWKVWS